MRKLLTLFAAGALMSALAVADDDPPNRAARLSYMAGTVTFQPTGEETDWAPADLNRALTTGDKIWVEQGGRTEIQTLNSVVRLNGHTNFSFLTVDDTTTQIQLSLGVMIVNLTGLAPEETYEIDTPQVAFTLLRPGIYRIEVNEAGDTSVITVRAGDGETTADGKAAPLHTGEQVVIHDAGYDKHGAPNTDEFDAWAAERDSKVAASVSVKMVAPGVVGVTDLDVAGAWRPAPIYGNVWYPNGIAVDWAPYRFGHWGFVGPWGWTWIDDAPWGYAPFHYGRWVRVGGLWGWAPGPVAVTAVYAPALVSFIGGVEVVGVVDPVSWVALSWGEPWYPSFGVSYGYYNRVNLCGTVFAAGIIAGVWGGAAVSLSFGHDPGAVNVIGRGGFAGGHAVGREFAHRDHFGGHAFDHAGSRREGVRGVGATREGRMGGHAPLRAGSRGVPPRGAMGRSAVTRHEPGARGGNFKGAGVAAKHGTSANGGHAGAFKGGAHGAAAANHSPAGGGAKGGAAAHSPAGGSKAGGSKAGTPAGGSKAGGAKAGTPAGGSKAGGSKAGTPAGGSKAGGAKAGTPAGGSKAGTPAGGSKAGSPAKAGTPAGGSKAGTPSHSSTPAGGAKAGSPAGGSKAASPATRSSTPAGGGAKAASPATRSSTPAGGGAKAAAPAQRQAAPAQRQAAPAARQAAPAARQAAPAARQAAPAARQAAPAARQAAPAQHAAPAAPRKK